MALASGDENTSGFNNYFIILAIAACAFLGLLFILGRRKKRLQRLRANSQRALAQDVAGFHGHGRPPRREWGWPSNPIHSRHPPRVERTEGLDERGEAPPPYVPGSKPPSLHSNDGLSRAETSRSVNRRPSSERDVELGDMTRPVYAPPAYHDPPVSATREDARDAGVEGITRPNPAVTR